MSSHCVQIARRLGRTARTAVAARAREREQVVERARVAANPRTPVVEHAAGEELVSDLRDHGAPRAVRAREDGDSTAAAWGKATAYYMVMWLFIPLFRTVVGLAAMWQVR